MNVAATILQQLGGNKFLVMTGANNLTSDESALCMQLRRNKAKAKFLRIELNANDTYNMIFRKTCKNYTFPIVAEYKDVYADQLQKLFTEVTGYYTSL